MSNGWTSQMGSCFGTADLLWGSHELERGRCRVMLKDAIDAGATVNQIIAEAEQYLKIRGAQQAHINEQTRKIRNLEI